MDDLITLEAVLFAWVKNHPKVQGAGQQRLAAGDEHAAAINR